MGSQVKAGFYGTRYRGVTAGRSERSNYRTPETVYDDSAGCVSRGAGAGFNVPVSRTFRRQRGGPGDPRSGAETLGRRGTGRGRPTRRPWWVGRQRRPTTTSTIGSMPEKGYQESKVGTIASSIARSSAEAMNGLVR
ncbi:hypothetical protein GCM10022223_01590 [Kineosporia mesophila]|uniref:Uncharacterized protein n=1 Tax=Kineosporia mesophila TaxID=566012 RepID=A0ABP6YWC8_9ACTN